MVIIMGRTKSKQFRPNFWTPTILHYSLNLDLKKEDLKCTPMSKSLRPSSVPLLLNWGEESA